MNGSICHILLLVNSKQVDNLLYLFVNQEAGPRDRYPWKNCKSGDQLYMTNNYLYWKILN